MERLDVIGMFTYHAPSSSDIDAMKRIRDKSLELGLLILELCPDSPQRDWAINYLHTSNLSANSAIILNNRIFIDTTMKYRGSDDA